MNEALKAIDGYKTYITLAIGMLAVFLNHLGWWPNDAVPLHMDPANWVSAEFALVLAATGRSAITKAATVPKP